MKQKFVVRRTSLAVLLGVWAIFLLLPSCKTDNEVPDISDEGANDWIYRVMTDYYLWYEDIPDREGLNFSQSPDKFFDSLLSDKDGVAFGGEWLIFSRIEKGEEQTKAIVASDSYGFEFASLKNGSHYYAWVIYVLPGSPAAEAGLKRGDWITSVGSDSPNVTNLSAFYSGGATTFSISRYENRSFVFDRKIQIAASRLVEDTPFLKDSVYTIDGKNIGYLMYNSFTSGLDNEGDEYDRQMKQIFARFKEKNVSEFVLDLRYNQGGLVTCAQLMASLLAPADALGQTFCLMEYNDKQTKRNTTLPLMQNSEMGNANLNLKQLYVLTGGSTASASEAVVNCLLPYMDKITLIGAKTVGKPVGSNTFESKEKYDWTLHPITLRIYNKEHKADYLNGFAPDVPVDELVAGNDLKPLGDTGELLLSEALSRITGREMRSRTASSEAGEGMLLTPSFERRKVKGLLWH